MEHNFIPGDIVQNFKRELVLADSNRYIYRILSVAEHTETGETMMVYEALYPPFGIWVRPYEMFMGKVDKVKYPQIKQEYRFEKITL